MTRRIISIKPKSILTKEKHYSVDAGQLVEVYFVYRVEIDDKGRTWHVPLKKDDYPDCNIKVSGILGGGIKSLRKAKSIHLLESL